LFKADLDAYAAKKGWKVKEGENEMAKKTYWTKCGRQFEKNSTAAVTGYTIDESDKAPENNALKVPASNDVQTFDYSTVDLETAEFLQEKAARITEIRIKSVITIGKELSEAFDKLSKVEYGEKTKTFENWVESIGISSRHARRYIDAYKYIAKNFRNIEDAEKIQPSLLFAISKPSAPKELQEAVISRDITSHKQYKELEEKLRKAQEETAKIKEESEEIKEWAEKQAKYADEHMKSRRRTEKELEDTKIALESAHLELRMLKQQLEQAKRNSDPAKLQELGQRISEYQQEIKNYQQQIGNLNKQLAEKNKQLKEKPIETSAVRVVETVPESVKIAIATRIIETFTSLSNMTKDEIAYTQEKMDRFHVAIIESAIKNLQAILESYNKNNADDDYEETESDYSNVCGTCRHFNNDDVSDEDFEAGRGLCDLSNCTVECDDCCDNFVSI